MKENLIIFISIIFIIGAETVAQYLLNHSAKKKKNEPFIIPLIFGMFMYSIVGLIYFFILRHIERISLANAVWNAGTAITITILGIIIFKEKLGIKEIGGILLITLGSMLL